MITALAVLPPTVVVLLLWRARRRDRELAARAAHEIRGALTAIGLTLERSLRRGEMQRPVAASCELQLARAAGRLCVFAGEGRDRDESSDLASVLGGQIAGWDAIAERAGRSVRVSCRASALPVDVGRAELVQLSSNLVANALEHGCGPVEVTADRHDGVVRLLVTDRGSGLPTPVRTITRRARNGRGRRGRGLAIASTIVRERGGRLEAIRSGGSGAGVIVELPAAGRS